MGQYRPQEYQCIMSKVSQYSNASLLKCIRGLSILYDHYVTKSDKTISSSLDSKLLPYCTGVFLLQKCDFETFIHYKKHFIDRYTIIHQYLIYSINTHIETLCINASQYVPSLSNTSHNESIRMASCNKDLYQLLAK